MAHEQTLPADSRTIVLSPLTKHGVYLWKLVVGDTWEIGVAVPAELRAYRQALRNITDTYSDPADVVFPDRPDIPFPGDAVSQGERLEAAELPELPDDE